MTGTGIDVIRGWLFSRQTSQSMGFLRKWELCKACVPIYKVFLRV